MKTLIMLLALMLNMTAWSQISPAKTTLDTVKEVFLKGSIDGDKMFMVLGTSNGLEISKKMMKDAINMDDLLEVKDDIQDIKETALNFQNIIKKPWKSLKKIPNAYKVDFEKAQDSYYSADSQISGVLKYSGWAVWAQVEGAYYLVIEAPVVMAAHTVGSSIALAWDVTALGLRVTWNVIKPVFALVASTAVMTYASVSSGIATTATLIAAGGVAVFKGGRWLIVEMPSRFFKPATVVKATNYNYDQQEELANKIQAFLTNYGDVFGDKILINSELKKYKSSFAISFEKNGLNAFELKTVIRNKKVEVNLEVKKAYFRELRKENSNLSRSELKAKLIEEMKLILSQILEQA